MISRVRLVNWKSHHETELTFSGGVNVLVGEMGAGKSSVLDALTFGLFGTTPALRSNRVTLDDMLRRVPSPAAEAVVEVDVTRDGTTYTVRREVERDKGVTASELRKDGDLVEAPQTTAVTAEVEELLGIDYDLFARVIYAEQNELDYFLTLRAGQRKEKIDELLRLDRFEQARSTLVTVINRLEGRRDDRLDDLASLEDELDEDAVAELDETIQGDREAIEELAEEKEELAEELDAVAEQLDEMQEVQEEHSELREKRTALRTRIETVDERIETLAADAGDAADLEPAEIAEKQEELAEEREEIAERQETITGLEKDIDHAEERLDALDEEQEELREKEEELVGLADLEEELEEVTDERNAVAKQIQQAEARIQDAAETLQHLSQAADECPTCGQELTDDHRVQVLQETRERKQELEEELDDLQETHADLREEREELAAERDDLLQLKRVDEELERVAEERDELADDLAEMQEELAEEREQHDPDRPDAIDDALDRLDTAAELHELREEREERVEELEGVEERIDDLGFDPDDLEAARERRSDLEKRLEVVQTKMADREEMLEERTKRREELQQKLDTVADHRERVAAYRAKIDALDELLAALEDTQVDLRQRFVTRVNDVMTDVWDRVYPYDDYDAIRLNAAEDYRLELQDDDGRWVPVDGQVSGGERHSAALTLRIALSIVLAPAWRILLLDEPTHNLDATTIEDLAETLRTRVADIVDQLFLITHEERLETAATGELYQLTKAGQRNGLTSVEQAGAGEELPAEEP